MSSIELLFGNCLEIVPTLIPQSVDAIVTDLPYGTTKCKWDTVIPFDDLWNIVKYILKPKGVFVTTSSQPFTSALIMSNVKWFRYEWIWDKVTARGHLVANRKPMKQHENILVFSQEKITNYYPIMIKRPDNKIEFRKTTEYSRSELLSKRNNKPPENILYDKWYPKTIITISNAGSSVKSVHPTQKPVQLYEYLIETYTKENDTVLDICMGSGTTGIACKNLNRNFIGIELNRNFYQIAQKRVEEHAT